MRDIFSQIQFLFPGGAFADFKTLYDLPAQAPFSDEVLDFLNALSKELMNDPAAKEYPDVMTFAFFCRMANLKQLKETSAKEQMKPVGKQERHHDAQLGPPSRTVVQEIKKR